MLEFNESTHTYTFNGVIVPGVTSVLSVLGGYESIPLQTLQRAAERGTAVHKATELSDLGTLDYSDLDDEILGCLMGWHKFLDDKKPELVAVEKQVYHPSLRYAGTLDRELVLDGKLSVLDIKSSYKLMPATAPQTAAYAEASNAHRKAKSDHIKNRYGLRLTADGNYELQQYKSLSDINVFLSCLNVWLWIEMHNQPKAKR